jgi:protein involved in polysaccharide export with SLBB domain
MPSSMKNSTQSFFALFLFFSFLLVSVSGLGQVTAPAGGGAPASAPTSAPAGAGQGTPSPGSTQATPAAQSTQQTEGVNQNTRSTTQENISNKLDQQLSGQTLSPEDSARNAIRQKLFGYSTFANKTYDPNPNLQIATPRDYTVGPGDELNIYLYGYFQKEYLNNTVNRDGFISLERAGNVQVAGKTIDEIKKILIDRFSRFVPGLLGSGGNAAQTSITVSIGSVRNILVYVTGEVINPSAYNISSLSTAFNALYLAGGPNEIGSFRKVRVIRNNKVVSTFDIYDFLTGANFKGDIRLQDNDNVQVGVFEKRVEISGFVKRQGIFELLPNEKLRDVITLAGGFADNAYTARLRVYRITPKERRIIDVEAKDYETFELKTGDEIIVGEILNRFENIVELEGAVMRPGEYALENSMSLKALIENADGLREDAFVGRVNIIRTRLDLSVENISVNLGDILRGDADDIPLKRLDIVVIPSAFDMAENAFVHIQGEVINKDLANNGGTFQYLANMTLEDLILKAGGFRESAQAAQVEVVRRKRDINPLASDARIAEVFLFDVSKDLTLTRNAANFMLMPYDEVIVRKSPNYQTQQYVTIEGEILIPGLYGITSRNEKISDILQRAGGLTNFAYLEGAALIRRTEKTEVEIMQSEQALGAVSTDARKGNLNVANSTIREENIGLNLRKILGNPGSSDDMIVQNGDFIRIPRKLETVQLKGELQYPTTVKFQKGQSFMDYVSQAGGFTNQSLRRRVNVIYPNGTTDRTRRFLVFNIYPRVEPGSEIIVPARKGNEMTAQQALQTAVNITSTLLTLILTVLAFRNLR